MILNIEYGNNLDDNHNPTMDRKFFSVGNPEEMILAQTGQVTSLQRHPSHLMTLPLYIPPSVDYLESKDVEVHYLGYYLKWDPQEVITMRLKIPVSRRTASEPRALYSKYSSIDDQIDMFPHYFTT